MGLDYCGALEWALALKEQIHFSLSFISCVILGKILNFLMFIIFIHKISWEEGLQRLN